MTITTVGYGDVTPKTFPGKIICIFAALFGVFLTSFLVVAMSRFFELSETQKKAHKHILCSKSAAVLISAQAKFFLAKKQYYILRMEQDPTVI